MSLFLRYDPTAASCLHVGGMSALGHVASAVEGPLLCAQLAGLPFEGK